MINKKLKSFVVIAAAAIIGTNACLNVFAEEQAYTDSDILKICKDIADYAENSISIETAGSSASDWLVYSRALAGRDTDGYLEALENYVREKYKEKGGLDLTTDYCRVSSVISALGGNPNEIAYTESDNINLFYDGIFNNPDLGRQGVNAYIWALIAINECNAIPPENSINSADKIIYSLLLSELSGGGFAVQGNSANPDVTAQALRALAPYAGDNTDVKDTLERCAKLLVSMKNSDGTYSSFGVPNLETTAQVTIALTALGGGFDDSIFDLTNENNLISACMKFYSDKNGVKGFRHTDADGEINVTATAQGLEALTAYLNYKGIAFEPEETNALEELSSGFGAYVNIALIMLLIFVLLLVMERVAKRRKKEE